MNDKPQPRRRWYQFSLRTMFVVVFVVSIPLAWVGYQLNWIRERRSALSYTDQTKAIPDPFALPVPAPGWLWLFGEQGREIIGCREHTTMTAAELQRLFPESEIQYFSPGR